MQTCATYSYEPGNFVWPVPFPYGSPTQVGVKVADRLGQERKLINGSDYMFHDGSVVYVLPEGHSLTIYLDAPYEEAVAQANARTVSGFAAQAASVPEPAAIQTQSEAVEIPQSSNDQLDAINAKLDALASERELALLAARDAASDQQIATIKEAGAGVTDSIEQAANAAIDEIDQSRSDAAAVMKAANARLADATSQLASATDNANAAAANIDQAAANAIADLELKVAQLEERLAASGNQQQAILMQTAKEAAGNASGIAEENAGIATLAANDSGNAADRAEGYAVQAGNYAAQAQNHAADAAMKVSDCTVLANKAERYAGLSVSNEAFSRDAANEARQVAWRINTQLTRPGIAVVQKPEDLIGAVDGFYIIDPELKQSPTLFYGLWPIENIEDIGWDGFFVLGLKPYSGTSAMPPEPLPAPPDVEPEPDDNDDKPASGLEWLPCDHTHTKEPAGA